MLEVSSGRGMQQLACTAHSWSLEASYNRGDMMKRLIATDRVVTLRRVRRVLRGTTLVAFASVAVAAGELTPGHAAEDAIPNLIGTWSGENHTISDKKGLKTWKKTIQITEQTDRRFRGYFTYSQGRKDFFGVIYPDNVSFTWVASDSKGYNHGRILGGDRIAACYVEPGEEATAGCADLTRQPAK